MTITPDTLRRIMQEVNGMDASSPTAIAAYLENASREFEESLEEHLARKGIHPWLLAEMDAAPLKRQVPDEDYYHRCLADHFNSAAYMEVKLGNRRGAHAGFIRALCCFDDPNLVEEADAVFAKKHDILKLVGMLHKKAGHGLTEIQYGGLVRAWTVLLSQGMYDPTVHLITRNHGHGTLGFRSMKPGGKSFINVGGCFAVLDLNAIEPEKLDIGFYDSVSPVDIRTQVLRDGLRNTMRIDPHVLPAILKRWFVRLADENQTIPQIVPFTMSSYKFGFDCRVAGIDMQVMLTLPTERK